METWMVILRLIHIIAGIFWAGTTFFLVGYVAPSVQASGPEGQKFMQQLSFRSGMTSALLGTATLAALSGIIMYILLTDLDTAIMEGTYYVVLLIGAVAGLAGWLVGYAIQYRTISKMKGIAAEIGASGGPPSPEQLAEMQALSQRVGLGSRITAVLLMIAIVAMAGASPIAAL
jgi:hypothetical protein